MYIHHVFFIHSSVEGRLGCFCLSSCKQCCCGPWGRVSFGIMFLHTRGGPSDIVPFVSCAESCAFRNPAAMFFSGGHPPIMGRGPLLPPRQSTMPTWLPALLNIAFCLSGAPLLMSHCILKCAPLSLKAASFSLAGSSLTVSVTPAPHSELAAHRLRQCWWGERSFSRAGSSLTICVTPAPHSERAPHGLHPCWWRGWCSLS